MRLRLLSSLCLLAALVTAGCATQPPPPPYAVAGIERSAGLRVEDLRPASESRSENFSLLITSEAYGILRLRDLPTTPAPLRLLAHRAHEAFPDLTAGEALKVHHFVVYANMQSSLRAGAAGAVLGGVIGAVTLSAMQPVAVDGVVRTVRIDHDIFERTVADEHRRAYYTAQENPSKARVYVIYIETEIQGRRVATRSLVPMPDQPTPLIALLDTCFAHHLAAYHDAGAPGKGREG